jgi:hypothetical protein
MTRWLDDFGGCSQEILASEVSKCWFESSNMLPVVGSFFALYEPSANTERRVCSERGRTFLVEICSTMFASR